MRKGRVGTTAVDYINCTMPDTGTYNRYSTTAAFAQANSSPVMTSQDVFFSSLLPRSFTAIALLLLRIVGTVEFRDTASKETPD